MGVPKTMLSKILNSNTGKEVSRIIESKAAKEAEQITKRAQDIASRKVQKEIAQKLKPEAKSILKNVEDITSNVTKEISDTSKFLMDKNNLRHATEISNSEKIGDSITNISKKIDYTVSPIINSHTNSVLSQVDMDSVAKHIPDTKKGMQEAMERGRNRGALKNAEDAPQVARQKWAEPSNAMASYDDIQKLDYQTRLDVLKKNALTDELTPMEGLADDISTRMNNALSSDDIQRVSSEMASKISGSSGFEGFKKKQVQRATDKTIAEDIQNNMTANINNAINDFGINNSTSFVAGPNFNNKLGYLENIQNGGLTLGDDSLKESFLGTIQSSIDNTMKNYTNFNDNMDIGEGFVKRIKDNATHIQNVDNVKSVGKSVAGLAMIGGLMHQLNSNKGQQSNAQLYNPNGPGYY